jgi:hypothetical protein
MALVIPQGLERQDVPISLHRTVNLDFFSHCVKMELSASCLLGMPRAPGL